MFERLYDVIIIIFSLLFWSGVEGKSLSGMTVSVMNSMEFSEKGDFIVNAKNHGLAQLFEP